MTENRWRTSSYSGGGANECVELDRRPERTAIRDSKNPGAGTLLFPDTAFHAFLSALKAGLPSPLR
ncbi:DUF397 domain-containing protein [Goodfellowiella coeruleoviolacea]|uniref:DUF397 domain-containing protein n=1 Tax=Goodfellowiella coeruleoviolacea TaxID=334858 RepID=A0AAE3GER4_9PSEU|nr:DUF397 domain-containing protein [Goodfellowiella coeruleoviolacea]MCP2165974.1 protein of unknown function (DUF397) [Goodfellowiella coeruleoviolacea]